MQFLATFSTSNKFLFGFGTLPLAFRMYSTYIHTHCNTSTLQSVSKYGTGAFGP